MLHTVETMQGSNTRHSSWKVQLAASKESARAGDSGGTLTFNGDIGRYLLARLC